MACYNSIFSPEKDEESWPEVIQRKVFSSLKKERESGSDEKTSRHLRCLRSVSVGYL